MKGIWERIKRLPTGWMVLLVGVSVTVLIMAVALLYRTYDYIEHDNEFCLSCHLMADPFERFEQSAHRGLGCKACHKPTMAARSRMALTQILEQPEEIEEHAEVTNARCAECHIEGDPDEWQLIASSAGHRIHLESDDPSLTGLQCVECHSVGLHRFAASDETCAQSGCHEETEIQLGAMSDLTIHCAGCHAFSKPVPEDVASEALAGALSPQREECLSCHAMRNMLSEFPDTEAHDAACGACHNPHEQRRSAEAVRSCTASGCHAGADTVSTMHRGLDSGELEDCTQCHTAHDWEAEGANCLSCHQDIYDQPAGPVALDSSRRRGAEPGAAIRFGAYTAPIGGHGTAGGVVASRRQEPQLASFSHTGHRGVGCESCHAMEPTHGALKVRTRSDCMACHHAAATIAAADDGCAACHDRREVAGRYAVSRPLELSVWDSRRSRELGFEHGWHVEVRCQTCHEGGGDLSADRLACSSCHESHHDVTAVTECRACHREAAEQTHDRSVHLGCAGAGCHSGEVAEALPSARPVCLTCHVEMVDHRPGRECGVCHAVAWEPGARAGGGSS